MKTLSAEKITRDAYDDQTQSHSEQFGIRNKSNEMESTEVHENIDKIGQFNIKIGTHCVRVASLTETARYTLRL